MSQLHSPAPTVSSDVLPTYSLSTQDDSAAAQGASPRRRWSPIVCAPTAGDAEANTAGVLPSCTAPSGVWWKRGMRGTTRRVLGRVWAWGGAAAPPRAAFCSCALSLAFASLFALSRNWSNLASRRRGNVRVGFGFQNHDSPGQMTVYLSPTALGTLLASRTLLSRGSRLFYALAVAGASGFRRAIPPHFEVASPA